MPKRDLYHEAVKNALIKGGWTVTHDPLVIKFKGMRWFVDLAAERISIDEEGEHKIAIEVKVFGGFSPVDDLEKALGQYNIDRFLLRETASERELFLAIPHEIYSKFFQRPAIQLVVSDQKIKRLVFDPIREEVMEWTS